MRNYYRMPAPYQDQRFFFGGPLIGGFVGGLLGGGLASAFLRPRPYYPTASILSLSTTLSAAPCTIWIWAWCSVWRCSGLWPIWWRWSIRIRMAVLRVMAHMVAVVHTDINKKSIR
ncbi:hypothetical protein ACA29_11340 [Lederbergia galactosidilytica]|uniref:Uncharacterized protein n=1 Tax=Lederbergia galactosidilytica TaxID=217031 RepID=A0A0Q9XUX4_9BACI|nr:hypothetical protein ACA29_11340 [Lederbergia galactosidilytica]